MTPQQTASDMKDAWGEDALNVAEVVLDALKRNIETDTLQLSEENKIDYWWQVMLELGYEA